MRVTPRFFTDSEKMTVDESDVKKIIDDVEAMNWHLRETIRVRELAATHRLEKMRRLRMLEEQKAWKREAGFDYTDTAAEMDARRSRTNLVSESLFYSKIFNPRCPHTHEEFALEMRVDVERLKMKIVLSPPAPWPQCDPLPRRLPAIGTGSDGPGVSRAETSTETEEIVPLQASVVGVLRFNCSSPEQNVFCFNQTSGRRRERNSRYFTTCRCSRGVRETNKEATAAKDDSMDYQSKQKVRPRRSRVKSLLFCRDKCLVAYTVCCFFPCVCLLSLVLFCHVRNAFEMIGRFLVPN